MSKMADALQPRLVTDLTSITGKIPSFAFADLVIARRASFDLDIDNNSQTFTIDFRDTAPVLTALASDCTRFCVAAFQSVENVSSGEQASLPWNLIKLYYSAFYSGHLILRLLGTPYCFLDSRHVGTINMLANAIGLEVTIPFVAGMYKCELGQPASSATFLRIDGRQSSTHEQFWKMFTSQLGTYAQEVLSSPMAVEDSQAVFATIEAFRSMLRSHGTETWLSLIRNEIQYRHAHGVWFPTSLRKAERSKLARKMAHLYRDPLGFSSGSNDILDDFASGCAFVIGLAHTLLRRVIELGAPNKIFLAYATERFCVRK